MPDKETRNAIFVLRGMPESAIEKEKDIYMHVSLTTAKHLIQ